VGELDRRRFLVAVAATVAVAGISWYPSGGPKEPVAHGDVPGLQPGPAIPALPLLLPPPPRGSRVPLPGGGVLSKLPGQGDLLAWTVDDGADTDVVRLYTEFAKDTGVRLTYFVTGAYRSWTDNSALLRPLVESGQIQLGNHTWSHPNLASLSSGAVADQIRRNAGFLNNTYGVDGTPYFRPPYGVHNADIDRVAADLGYPTITMWSGTIGDSRPENETTMIANATDSFQPQQIILAHANLPTITQCYAQLMNIIDSRNLQTVTLNDVFG
jgi:peptidoglycan/xylan/chitin deacetylase (PgdA/CDA1 family)